MWSINGLYFTWHDKNEEFLVPKHQMNESVTESIMTEFIE